MTDSLKLQGEVSLDSSGAEQALGRVGQAGVSMADKVGQAARQAGSEIAKIGDGGDQAAQKLDTSTRSLIASVQRATAQLQSGTKGSREFFESLAQQRGISTGILQPYLDQLDQVAAKQRVAKQSGDFLDSVRAQIAGLRDQIIEQNGGTEALLRYKAAEAGASAEASHLITQLTNMRAAQAAATAAVRADAAAQREAAQAQATRTGFVNDLRQQADAIGKTRSELLALKAAQLGVATEAAPFIAKLREAEQATHGVGTSANLTTAQMQGLTHSARGFFDMVVAGQSPLKAFALESAKLSGTFGGAGAAVDGVKTAIGGLFSPTALAIGAAAAFAAGIGAVAYAAAQGAAELKKFNEANILTGNALGVTNSQFGQLRDAIGGIATQGKAAEVLTEIAANGTLAGSAVRQVAEAAILMEKATGIATAETVKQFAELAKSPAEAAAKLNDSTNFLTASLYRQIKALEEQGQHVAAANLAENAYAEALKNRAQAVLDNSGIMVKAWRGVTGAAKDAWDAMLGIGRQVTNADQIALLQRNLADRQARNKSLGIGDSNGDSSMTSDIKQQISLLQENERIEKRMVTVGAERAAQAKAEIGFSAIEQATRTKTQQLEQEINKIRELGLAAGRSQLDIDKQIANARQKYAETGGLDQLAGIKAAAVTAQQTIDLLQKQMDSGDRVGITKLTEAEVKINEIKAKLTVTTNGATRANLQHALSVAQNTVVLEKEAVAMTKRRDAWLKALAVVDEQTAANDKLADSYQQQALEQQAVAASFGKSDIAVKQLLLSQTQVQIQEAEATDTFDPKYLASLYAKKAGLEALIPALQAVAQKQEALNLSHISDANRNDAAYLATELSLIGQTAEVRDRILTQKRIELEYDQKILDLQKKGLTAEDLAADTAQLQQQKQVALNNAATKQFIDDWQRVTDQIEGLGHQLWDDLFAGGHDAFKRIGQDIKKFLLDELYQLTVKKWIIQIASSVTGGLAGTAGSALSGVSTGLSLANAASGASSLYTVGSQVFGGSMSVANAAGTLAANATGTGIDGLLLTNGAYGTAASGSAAAAGGTAAGMAGAAGLAGIIALGAYIDYKIDKKAGLPGWAPLIAPGLGVAAMLLGIQAPGGPKGGAYIGAATANNRGVGVGSEEQTADQVTAVKNAVSTLTDSYKALLKTFGGKGGVTFGLGYETDPRGTAPSGVEATARDANGNVVFSQANNDVGRDDKSLTAEISLQSERAVLAALKASDLPAKIQEYIAKLDPMTATSAEIESAFAVVTEVKAFDDALLNLGSSFDSLRNLSVYASDSLITLGGGLENFTALVQGYAENFLTPEQKVDATAGAISSALKTAGLDYTADAIKGMTRDDFTDLVNYEQGIASVNKEAGTAYIALLKVSGAFNELHPALEAMASLTSRNLNAGLSSYYKDFGTPDEQRYSSAQGIANTLQASGLNLSAEQVLGMTVDDFKNLVYTTAQNVKNGVAGAGAAAFALNNVADAFHNLWDQANGAQAWFDAYVQANDAVTKLERANAQASADFLAEALNSVGDAFRATAKSIKDEIDAIRGDFAKDVNPQNLKGAQDAFQSTLLSVMQGKGGADKLPALAQALLTQEQGQAGSYLDLLTVQAATAQQLQDALPYLQKLQMSQTAQLASALSGSQVSIPKFQGGAPASYGASPVVAAIDSLNHRIDRLHTAVEAVAVHTQATSSNTKRAVERGVPALTDPSA